MSTWYKKANTEFNVGPVFHGTLSNPFDEFKTDGLGAHFGTLGQAHDRVQSKIEDQAKGQPRYIEAYLRIKNPLRLCDGYWNDPQEMIEDIENWGVKMPEEFTEYQNTTMKNDRAMIQKIKAYLVSLGYDGIVYSNDGEIDLIGGKVWADSYIVFDPSQIKIVNQNVVLPKKT
jgi:hypothetical protein